MRRRHLGAIRHIQISDPLPLPPVPQKTRLHRFLRQCSHYAYFPALTAQKPTPLGNTTGILRTLWLDGGQVCRNQVLCHSCEIGPHLTTRLHRISPAIFNGVTSTSRGH